MASYPAEGVSGRGEEMSLESGFKAAIMVRVHGAWGDGDGVVVVADNDDEDEDDNDDENGVTFN